MGSYQHFPSRVGALSFALLTLTALVALGSTRAWASSPDEASGNIARQVVAEAAGLDLQRTRVVSITPREFPDASLDCPQPGMAYAQVLTPGFVVIVEADGRRFDVRVAGSAGRICHRRKANRAIGADAGQDPARLADAARQDLAVRLQAEADRIRVNNVHRLAAGERFEGCGEVCGDDPARCGYGISLVFGDREFGYISDGDTVRPCPEIATR
jgi:hypothetical protein